MATKNTKLAGERAYFDNAAKQFIWPIDHVDKQIFVPENELELAENDLMVQHFRNRGWHIQLVFGEVLKTNVYEKPEFKSRFLVKEVQVLEQTQFHLNQRFRVPSTECELKISEIDKKSIHLQYLNRHKPEIVTTFENLQRSISMGVWIVI